MTQRLAESQAEVGNYQRTLEEKVTQRTKELEVATAHAYKLAQHDILTGLPNRSLLNQRLKQILAQAVRDNLQVACLFLDFDHFKRINDTLGHDAATSCCNRSRSGSRAPCARATPWRGWAATSSSSCCRSSRPRTARSR